MDLKEARQIVGRGRLEHLLDFGEESVEELPARNGLPRVGGPIALGLLVGRLA